MEPWVGFMRNQATNPPGALLVWMLFNMLIAPLTYAIRIRDALSGIPLRPEDSAPFLQLGLLVAGAGVLPGLGLLCVMQAVANTLLVLISTPVHRSEYAWSTGCESLVPPAADFGAHTVLATNDYCTSWGLPAKLFLFGSFNDHVAHHLFPTVDLSKQYRIRQLFLEVW